jgi:hypothetical protein
MSVAQMPVADPPVPLLLPPVPLPLPPLPVLPPVPVGIVSLLEQEIANVDSNVRQTPAHREPVLITAPYGGGQGG